MEGGGGGGGGGGGRLEVKTMTHMQMQGPRDSLNFKLFTIIIEKTNTNVYTPLYT